MNYYYTHCYQQIVSYLTTIDLFQDAVDGVGDAFNDLGDGKL